MVMHGQMRKARKSFAKVLGSRCQLLGATRRIPEGREEPEAAGEAPATVKLPAPRKKLRRRCPEQKEHQGMVRIVP